MASKILAGNRSVFYTCQCPYIMLFIHQMTEEEKKKILLLSGLYFSYCDY